MNIEAFVTKTVKKINDFDEKNMDCIKRIVAEAIAYYGLKSYEEVEDTKLGIVNILHIHSIAEENLLSKVVQLSLMDDKGFNVEVVYDGRVIREY